jgi:2-oxoglutarate dehydrogenase complex dehydrogenase (E1) component-like enzyme
LWTNIRIWGQLEDTFAKSKDYKPSSKEWLTSSWNGFASPKDLATKVLPHLPTSVDAEILKEIGKAISSYPKDFNIHNNLKRIIANRGKSIVDNTGVDMSTAEALAFGSLVKEGYHVRVSGQDVERGTFSQRHAVLHDQKTEKTYVPLMHIEGEKVGSFVISNSSLSEFGVLGFEYGYSLSSPEALVMCEMQFGDFANVLSPQERADSRMHNVSLTSLLRRESRNGLNDLDWYCRYLMVTMAKVPNIPVAVSNDSYNFAMKIPVSSPRRKRGIVNIRYIPPY